jgi:hypothetical protein
VSALDLSGFENKELSRLGMPKGIIMRHRPAHFQRTVLTLALTLAPVLVLAPVLILILVLVSVFIPVVGIFWSVCADLTAKFYFLY